MVYPLTLGFRRKPHGLDGFLKELGFELDGSLEADENRPYRITRYSLEDSNNIIEFFYHEGVYEDVWPIIAPETKFVTEGTLMSHMNGSNVKKRDRILDSLIARYHVKVYDPIQDIVRD